MITRILVMGLPGSGKTYLATALQKELHEKGFTVEWFNADEVRERFDDWDFSEAGRIRQGHRMRDLANKSTADFVIIDMVAPLTEMRDLIAPDVLVWMDTISEGRYQDTNRMFEPPEYYDLHVTTQDADKWTKVLYEQISHKI